MNYHPPKLLDELAAQYVLGTLRGPARRRFERFFHGNAAALAAVHRWEDRLVDLIAEVRPVQPSPLIWERIRLRIRREHAARRRQALRRWYRPALAMAAGVAALALALGWWNWRGPGATQLVANLVDQQQVQHWRIEASRNRSELRVSAAAGLALEPTRAYELWALPGAGAAPVSLGLLPKSGRGTLKLSEAQQLALAGSRQLAVSLEPPGGSSTGAPTGPVLLLAQIAAAG